MPVSKTSPNLATDWAIVQGYHKAQFIQFAVLVRGSKTCLIWSNFSFNKYQYSVRQIVFCLQSYNKQYIFFTFFQFPSICSFLTWSNGNSHWWARRTSLSTYKQFDSSFSWINQSSNIKYLPWWGKWWKWHKAWYILTRVTLRNVFNLNYEKYSIWVTRITHLEKSRSLCCQRRPFFTALPRPDQDEDIEILPKYEDIYTLPNFKSACRLLVKRLLSV